MKLQETLKEANEARKYQLYGELLTANLYAVNKGMREIEVVNYYDEKGSMVVIPLNPLKTPSENAQRYFSANIKRRKTHLTLYKIKSKKQKMKFIILIAYYSK